MRNDKAADRLDVQAAMATLTRCEPDLAYRDPRCTDRGPMQVSPLGAYVSYVEVAELIAADKARVERTGPGLNERERFILFVYLLARDVAPLSAIAEKIRDVVECVEHAEAMVYSNPHLREWAIHASRNFHHAKLNPNAWSGGTEQERHR